MIACASPNCLRPDQTLVLPCTTLHTCVQGAEADAALADGPPEVQPVAALMRVQLSLAAGDRGAAAALLADLPDSELRHRPAVVATLASLQVCDLYLHVTVRGTYMDTKHGKRVVCRARPQHFRCNAT